MAKAAKTFKELLVYRLAYNGNVAAGQLAVFQGASEIYCHSAQMRKAAISIAANIAEMETLLEQVSKLLVA